jgi:hypothetical protein
LSPVPRRPLHQEDQDDRAQERQDPWHGRRWNTQHLRQFLRSRLLIISNRDRRRGYRRSGADAGAIASLRRQRRIGQRLGSVLRARIVGFSFLQTLGIDHQSLAVHGLLLAQ